VGTFRGHQWLILLAITGYFYLAIDTGTILLSPRNPSAQPIAIPAGPKSDSAALAEWLAALGRS